MYEHALVMRTAVLGSDGPKETFACIKNGIGRPEKRICTPLRGRGGARLLILCTYMTGGIQKSDIEEG